MRMNEDDGSAIYSCLLVYWCSPTVPRRAWAHVTRRHTMWLASARQESSLAQRRGGGPRRGPRKFIVVELTCQLHVYSKEKLRGMG